MRALMTALSAAASLTIAYPAIAAVTVTTTTGTPLANQIYGIASVGTTVYGSSPSNDAIANVTFTGDTQISVGSGFAQINDATPNTADFTSLIINPDQAFDAFKFSVMLSGAGTVDVYTLLTSAGLDANNIANYTLCAACSYSADNSNLNMLLTGGIFDGFAIKTSAPIAFFEVKQLTFNGVTSAVPEPGTWGMMLLGFAGMGMAMRRGRKQRNDKLLQIA